MKARDPTSQWNGAVARPLATGKPFSCEILGIEVTGRVATATLRETDHHGVVIDYLHLLESGDS
jgi:hypothetical protein